MDDSGDPVIIRFPLTMHPTSISPLYQVPYRDIGATLQANNISTGLGDDDEKPRPFGPVAEVCIIVILGLIILFTICGNCLVILSVCLDRKLRKTPNILVINLAVADLAVALLVMPFGAAYEITGRWIFGSALCNTYVTFDMLCCTASITNLCMISMDRYLVITRPLRYSNKRTPRLMLLFVAIVWTLAISISTSQFFIGGAHNDGIDCLINQNYTFTIFSTFGAFYIPLIIMIVLYYKIFQAARRSREADLRQRPGLGRRGSPISQSSNSIYSNIRNSIHGSHEGMLKKRDSDGTVTSSENGDELPNYKGMPRPSSSLSKKSTRITYILEKGRNSLSSLGSARRLITSKEPKAVRTLGVIVGCFTLCWLPFFILALIRPYCHHCYISPILQNVVLWLGYINSTLNPVIYPLFNKDFMPAYRKMLSCRWSFQEPREYDDSYWRNERRRSSIGLPPNGVLYKTDSESSHGKSMSRSSVQFDDAPQIRKYSLKMDILNCNSTSLLPPIEREEINEDTDDSDVERTDV